MTEEDPLITKMKTKHYLGDGLYAHFDGFQYILSTEREFTEHYVALEPEVFNALLEYRLFIQELIKQLRSKLDET